MKSPAARALCVGISIAGVLGFLHLLGVGLTLLFALGLFISFLVLVVPWVAANWAGDISRYVRGRFWAREQGQFHSYNGVPLQIEDDGRHVWMDGQGLMRALGRLEPEDALAARHAARWRRDSTGRLMLRVDAVVNHLATSPGRLDPRTVRLRRYLEEDVLFPAAERRRRSETMR